MKATKKHLITALIAGVVAALCLVAATTAGARGDRAARIDSDRDGASNRCEKQAGLDKSVKDTDDDGTIDGLEDSDSDGLNNAAESRLRTNCGRANKRVRIGEATVVSYSSDDGLTLKIGKRGLIKGSLSAKLVCEQDVVSDDESEDEDEDFGDFFRGGRGGWERGRGGDWDDEPDTESCTSDDLTEDREVISATLRKGVFTRIHLAAEDAGDY